MATGAGKRGKPGVAGFAMAAREVVLKEDECTALFAFLLSFLFIISAHYPRSSLTVLFLSLGRRGLCRKDKEIEVREWRKHGMQLRNDIVATACSTSLWHVVGCAFHIEKIKN